MVSSQGETSVPQGSILGPFFFLSHINDISVTQFADDASLFSLIYHAKTVYELNKDLQKKKKNRWLWIPVESVIKSRS